MEGHRVLAMRRDARPGAGTRVGRPNTEDMRALALALYAPCPDATTASGAHSGYLPRSPDHL